ncbi:uncharacterized protein LOC120070932 [Benincasa hispida]|uniref:uncharacterized protein LOC120070932 n=1 Tax=Benincasa hispida TaxID=102211 RepID=UPI0019023317|nr:uncharacterized protein LOC120070932 [Benincasa hispida]XP_038878773.1 uncharacterized protein LOC120070932 [Benincasa hispida]XP_038878774.1 uncharacterized protein LOC120070932 [Benincasa hispida]
MSLSKSNDSNDDVVVMPPPTPPRKDESEETVSKCKWKKEEKIIYVASDSAFSTSGRVIDPFRTSLSPTTVEALVCAQNYVHKTGYVLNKLALVYDNTWRKLKMKRKSS